MTCKTRRKGQTRNVKKEKTRNGKRKGSDIKRGG